jgi:hypothetical protein
MNNSGTSFHLGDSADYEVTHILDPTCTRLSKTRGAIPYEEVRRKAGLVYTPCKRRKDTFAAIALTLAAVTFGAIIVAILALVILAI